MKTPDAFAAYHADLIEAAYDCVDRLVVNCYYPLGQAGGGFRIFWRQWKGGDSGLNNQALRQAAGDLARRLKAHCQKHGILWIECGPGDLKYEIAREHRPKDPAFRGVFARLSIPAVDKTYRYWRGAFFKICLRRVYVISGGDARVVR